MPNEAERLERREKRVSDAKGYAEDLLLKIQSTEDAMEVLSESTSNTDKNEHRRLKIELRKLRAEAENSDRAIAQAEVDPEMIDAIAANMQI